MSIWKNRYTRFGRIICYLSHLDSGRKKLFSHKTKGAPSPKARDFHQFFSSCGSQRARPYRKPSKYSLSFTNITSEIKTMGCWCVQTFFSAQKQGFTSPKSARFSSVFSLNFLHHANVWRRAWHCWKALSTRFPKVLSSISQVPVVQLSNRFSS